MCDTHLGLLDGAPEQLVGVLEVVLVQRPIEGDVDGGGGLLPPPSPACLLP